MLWPLSIRGGARRVKLLGMDGDRQRIDKWLWAARLLKTRSLAIDAVRGGHVQVNGQRVKPAKEVGAGDRIELRLGPRRHLTVDVRGCAERRGPASEAALLYEETAESVAAREQAAAEARLAAPRPGAGGGGAPKGDRPRAGAERRAPCGREGPRG